MASANERYKDKPKAKTKRDTRVCLAISKTMSGSPPTTTCLDGTVACLDGGDVRRQQQEPSAESVARNHAANVAASKGKKTKKSIRTGGQKEEESSERSSVVRPEAVAVVVVEPQIAINLVEITETEPPADGGAESAAGCAIIAEAVPEHPEGSAGGYQTATANTDSTKSLDDVRENFIILVSHNKLQYFMLAALIYTVISLCVALRYILLHHNHPPASGGGVPQTQRTPPMQQQSHHLTITAHHLLHNNSSLQQLPSLATTGWLVFCIHLLSLMGLSIVLTITTLKFNARQDNFSRHPRWLQTAGILLPFSTIFIQSIISFMINLDSTTTISDINHLELATTKQPHRAEVERPALLRRANGFHLLCPLLVTIYFLPVLMKGDTYLDKRPWRYLLFLPTLVIAITQLWLQCSPLSTPNGLFDDVALIQLSCMMLAILFGLRMRRKLVLAVTQATFAGAAQLIEAKVSLEHQRQQQETLLLSVLPAYVAEQVKRNMLKKTTSAATSATSSADLDQSTGGNPACIVPTIIAPNNQASNSWKSRSYTTLHGPNSIQSTTLDSIADGVKQSNLQVAATAAAGGSERVRNSFQLPTKALTSGLAAISETLASSNSQQQDFSSKKVSQATPSQAQMIISNCSPNPSPGAGQARRGFNELYIRTYNNVSLLYGDIVGFTRLCTQLSSSQLVRVLNDLFSHFDYLAEHHRIMRIKILGDCYYGVSGIPEFAVMGAKSRASRNDNHAINCVNMGLDMIHYIRCLNVERASLGCGLNQAAGQCSPMPPFELNMRIGIHTGHIHSGVIGLKKWQFDVWSNDVSIAMHCESSGIAGRVQVTQATVQQLNGAFTYENAYGSMRDSFLASKDINTYLIRDRVVHQQQQQQHDSLIVTQGKQDNLIHTSGSHLDWPATQEGDSRSKSSLKKSHSHETTRSGGLGEPPSQQMDQFNIWAATIGTIRQILLAGETCNANGLNSYGLALNHHDIWPATLRYRDQRIRKLHANRPLIHPLQELTTCLLMITLVYLISQRQLPEWGRWLQVSIMIGSAFLLMFKLWQQFVSKNHLRAGPHSNDADPLDLLEPHQVIKDDGRANGNCHRSAWTACLFALDLASKLSSSISHHTNRFINMISARIKPKMINTFLIIITVMSILAIQVIAMKTAIAQCAINKWQVDDEKYELIVILLLFMLNSTLNLLSYRTKSILISIMLCWHLVRMLLFASASSLTSFRWLCDSKIEASQQRFTIDAYQTLIDGLNDALLVAVMLWSLAYARQIEYTDKTNFLWRNRLNVDHEELEYISGINKVLLENILPSHVVQHYLAHPNEQPKMTQLMPSLSAYMRMSFSDLRNQNNGLYHEQHDSVAVMFASIPHFYEFYDESDISKQGLGCIALLNEIICDFDKLLLKNKFSRIEKIKTIGSSYMAAAGLRPSNLCGGARPSNASQCSVSSSTNHRSSLVNPRNATGSRQLVTPPLGVPSLRLGAANSSGSDYQLLADDRRLVMSQQKLNLICMIKFATSLMTALNGINKQSFQVFKLRIGVNTGSVIAGIIGAQRPFYDIWGDCVNIASRMESLGEVGRIQVEERTAKLLMDSLCLDTYSITRRGPIDVKGKGGMVTYFVDKKEASIASEPQRVENFRPATAQQVTDIHARPS